MVDKAITAVRLPGKSDRTLQILSELFTQKHIFSALDGRIKNLVGIHRLFQNIENGFVRVYAALENDQLIGVCFGHPQNDYFCTHLAFLRNVNTLAACRACADVMLKEYESEGVNIKGIVGHIPVSNRAALRFARIFGCEDLGVNENVTFIHNNNKIPCHILRLEMR